MMNDILVLRAEDINKVLCGMELEIMHFVANTYITHNNGLTSLPHSVFLRFPEDDKNRIIGLPAYIGGEFNIAGMKWISSFPGNTKKGMERASAVTILNNMETGRCETILEGSIISAKRTAASAALAAVTLHPNADETTVGIVGCGRINHEIIYFIHAVFPSLNKIILFDKDPERASRFAETLKVMNLTVEIVSSIEDVFKKAKLISFATTAGTPYVKNIKYCDANTTILNISLRDFSPEVVGDCNNIVDDIDHVLRERTSLHLTEEKLGNRDFVLSTLGDILEKKQQARKGNKPVMFHPFGLGILDITFANFVKGKAIVNGLGIKIEKFVE
ncbi:2,3-diaminopropionate biosynthesis protein SbnB [Bacillus atrophaeus]|uniref:2,3-diaminopropionate biosynthesis protein SbnB n=1 Tax=Bacillus atrophaeus TaxID=1452 RepID=UPI00227DF42A|nr:2,3-diaminopropionate biosynthesis protein SbnB [Bacillus atrophaeus]MCY8499317.1 2,3-diaminopropionate biosynthesis protein SbnB [Bacillus atrophaeus]MCY8814951.1 2,3-diaminopropionate biosynthesis protein SbnB [Bacillus atrophaeus]MCY8823184.1 2,3-diaminopropionate biosynthesis protein SbnB [Bacillus atrophaeus]MCY8831165.1 2,3-diaminopropionate biosynthesis protein SbnB [Bacillus atrophaeus]MCY8834844.1 2,3-diaminopropionate biosynthesis protein SbnB [Bacillus atrophaeus]